MSNERLSNEQAIEQMDLEKQMWDTLLLVTYFLFINLDLLVVGQG